MKEVLFRGKVYRKNRRTGEYLDCGWVYGDFYRYYNGSLHYTITNIDDVEMQSREYSVEIGTVGEWTGLTDKNGTKIFADDIVKCHDHPTGVENTIGKVYWKDGKWLVTWSMIALGDFGTAWTEVIGNVHENSELLTDRHEA